MLTLFILGRILFGGYFIYNGIRNLLRLRILVNSVRSKGVPFPTFTVPFSALLILVGGLNVLLGAYPVPGLILLIVFLVPVTFTMHDFWRIDDPRQRAIQRINFTKNIALLGAILMMLAIPRPWPMTLFAG
jgi:putative oxidoreductase